MDLDRATQLALDHVGAEKRVVFCADVPEVNLFFYDPTDDDYLFVVLDRKIFKVGGSNYIAVSKTTGRVREIGYAGE